MLRRCWYILATALPFLTLSCLLVQHRPDSAVPDPPGSHLAKYGIVVPVGPYGAWDSGMVESPVVWYDSIHESYGMVYTGYASIDSTKRGYKYVAQPQVGLAWSNDLLHWKKDPVSPIFGGSGIAGSPDEEGTSGPSYGWKTRRTICSTSGLLARDMRRERRQ